ncbi:uncharacterized protein EAF02_003428 [Botrytis sinoallii]|uniref:uncharacterized protein n=1 Tax=Botrytis sinoallii TaxID=1463999 RepID=UPI0018FFF721|nr:uncharacterized protein EAF02_003428 [Botrytis sinoallii]KAF7886781.1 hypothetical protein EAF02_003428 [Botrytis sinoallii]
MATSANFIPLGGVDKTHEFDQPMKKRDAGYRAKSLSAGKPKVIGATKEERSRIAREVRNAAKKEKKKAKSDAKKARKLNGIMTRRATRNPEKYNKNKERNRLHAIDVERYKIRLNAVNQAQKLAAVHDPSGVSFNVGEVVTLEDGTVKSKKSLERKQELAEGKQSVQNEETAVPEGINPERLHLLDGEKKSHISKTALKKKKMYEPKPIPPKPIIPEGVALPEGEENWLALWDISDGQIEQRIAMAKREAGNAKRDLRRRQREEAKFRRLMKAKRRNAQKMGIVFDPIAAKNEILGDNDDDEDDEEASDSENESNSDSDSESDNEEDSEETKAKKREEKKQKPRFNLDESQLNAIVKKEIQRVRKDTRKQEKIMGVYEKEPKVMTEEQKVALKEARIKRKAEKKAEKRAKKEEEAKLGVVSLKGKQNRKARKELRRAERAKKAEENGDAPVTENVKEDEDEGGVDLLGSLEMALNQPEETKEQKKARKKAEKAEKAEKETSEAVEESKEERKARKKAEKAAKVATDEPTPAAVTEPIEEIKEEKKARKKAEKAAKSTPVVVKEETPQPEPVAEESKKRKRSKEEKESLKKKSKPTEEPEEPKAEKEIAAQWNADALDGDAQRKSKFLRLLGAGKGGAVSGKGVEAKGKGDIQKVQSELERQYDYGMKMKHDGGGKRRGLGA